ncbi:MAG TPA: aminotransferase class I/II-fold pyridoxal phosphate-dependent enzyme [Thermomicrobiales bacterium]|jgi:aminotransferase|nr:aminotransferase class I/II-fold pyridoxal phosphate-dependent enzyme [Thermomicrobiales bacterium]
MTSENMTSRVGEPSRPSGDARVSSSANGTGSTARNVVTSATSGSGALRIAQGVDAVPQSGIRRLFDIVTEMDDVISLGVGEPDFSTPWRVREAAIHGLEKRRVTYTGNSGLPELREAIARYIDGRTGVRYQSDGEVLVTVGVSEALDLALRAILDPGDEVIVVEPSYVSYKPCIWFAGGVPVPLPTRAEHRFVPQADEFEALITPRTRAIMINSPNNPTGAAYSREDLLPIAAVAERHDLLVISDEVYERLSFDADHVSFVSLPGMARRTLLLNGFSKAYAMTGWRLGYACGPEPLIAAMTKIHQYTALCASRTAQEAGVEALRHADDDVEAMVEDYDARRRLVVAGLNQIGLPCHLPEGAFYVFPDIRPTGLTSAAFAERLLMEGRVAVVPGEAFGDSGEGHVRISYAYAVPQIEEALDRIGRFVASLPGFPVAPLAEPTPAAALKV